MLVEEIKKIANDMRPGNSFDDELIERWIDECDASIQLEIAHKKPEEVIRLRAPLLIKGNNYKKGTRAGYIVSGEYTLFVAKKDVTNAILPQDDVESWEQIPFETYVGFPHDKLYYLYVIAMMDFANHEYEKYANDKEVYNAAYDEFAKWWQRKYRYTFKEGYDAYQADR